MLEKKGVILRDEFRSLLVEVDLEDGVHDGKLAKPAPTPVPRGRAAAPAGPRTIPPTDSALEMPETAVPPADDSGMLRHPHADPACGHRSVDAALERPAVLCACCSRSPSSPWSPSTGGTTTPHKLIVSLSFGLPVAGYAGVHAPAALAHTGLEYVAFISLLGALYVISGGVRLKGSLSGRTRRQRRPSSSSAACWPT